MSQQDGNGPWEPPRPWGEPGQPQRGQQPQWAPPPYGQQEPYGQHGPYGQQPPYNQQQPYGNYGPGYRPPLYVAPPKPGTVPLRPLMFGEVLDGAFQAIRRNPKAMLGASFLAQALTAIVVAVFTALSATSAFSIEDQLGSVDGPGIDGSAAGLLLGLAGGSIVVVLLGLFISAVLQGAMVVPVARSVLNRRTTFGQMWSLSRAHAWALVRLAAVYLGAVVLGLGLMLLLSYLVVQAMDGPGALLVLPLWLVAFLAAVWIGVKVMVAPAAIVVEQIGAFAGIRRSWTLTTFHWWRLLGISLVVAILVSVIAQIVTFPVGMLSGMVTGVALPHSDPTQVAVAAVVTAVLLAVVTAAVGAVGYAYQTSVMALLYLDLRMRREGLDITLHRQLETGSDPGGVPGRAAEPDAGQGFGGAGAGYGL
ncbi:hypothetical protein V1638_02615 [Pseudarthrobacter sp. J64]|uniref:hypothetical protein n=1 Tax=Pseudarthrobacter sp. J64 TaxID=3116485 RepID=UPI002E801671|nr:hypothetical protein [Pseudarthrobacter sp. J64]MEE2568291.1 hypothetical protein [Pseudarthrobacter sp. J64]